MDVVLTAGAVTAALLTVGGVLWWLVSPRITTGVERVCRRAVSDALVELDERVEALELAVRHSHHPNRLVELADLLHLTREHGDATDYGHPVVPIRPTRPRRERHTHE